VDHPGVVHTVIHLVGHTVGYKLGHTYVTHLKFSRWLRTSSALQAACHSPLAEESMASAGPITVTVTVLHPAAGPKYREALANEPGVSAASPACAVQCFFFVSQALIKPHSTVCAVYCMPQAFREEGSKQPLYRVRFQQTDVWELYRGKLQAELHCSLMCYVCW
jgi:hypothetical protein